MSILFDNISLIRDEMCLLILPHFQDLTPNMASEDLHLHFYSPLFTRWIWCSKAEAALYPRPAVSPQEWVESVVLITQVDIQTGRLPQPRPCAPAGKPLAGCLGSAAPCRLSQRGGLRSVFADRGCPHAQWKQGWRKEKKRRKSSVTSRLMGRGITVRLCDWWCCLHLCAKSSKHTVSGWQGCVGCSRLRLKFKPSREYSGHCSCPLLSCICPTLTLQTVLCWSKSVHCPTKLKCSQATSCQIRICHLQSLQSEAKLILILKKKQKKTSNPQNAAAAMATRNQH